MSIWDMRECESETERKIIGSKAVFLPCLYYYEAAFKSLNHRETISVVRFIMYDQHNW